MAIKYCCQNSIFLVSWELNSNILDNPQTFSSFSLHLLLTLFTPSRHTRWLFPKTLCPWTFSCSVNAGCTRGGSMSVMRRVKECQEKVQREGGENIEFWQKSFIDPYYDTFWGKLTFNKECPIKVFSWIFFLIWVYCLIDFGFS